MTNSSMDNAGGPTSTSSTHNSDHGRIRKFAPLNPGKDNVHNAPKLVGIIFDVDGTLCLPQNHMFGEMRKALSIPKSVDILSHIRSLTTEPTDPTDKTSSPQYQASAKIRAIESHHMTHQIPQPGLQELFEYLSRQNIKRALCTRNFLGPVQHLLDSFLSEEIRRDITPIITRETEGVMPKPSPEGLWYIAESWGLLVDQKPEEVLDQAEKALQVQSNGTANTSSDNSIQASKMTEIARRVLGSRIIMVGDSVDDMEAGYRAGAATVLLLNEHNKYLVDEGSELVDLTIDRLDELVDVLENGFEGKKVIRKEIDM